MVPVTSSPLHIAGHAAVANAQLHCGTKTQPWLLEAPGGQRINISLLDFTPAPKGSNALTVDCVRQYGYVIDKSTIGKKNVSVCVSTQSQRLSNVYVSKSNTVELVLLSHFQHVGADINFLVKLQGNSSISLSVMLRCL